VWAPSPPPPPLAGVCVGRGEAGFPTPLFPLQRVCAVWVECVPSFPLFPPLFRGAGRREGVLGRRGDRFFWRFPLSLPSAPSLPSLSFLVFFFFFWTTPSCSRLVSVCVCGCGASVCVCVVRVCNATTGLKEKKEAGCLGRPPLSLSFARFGGRTHAPRAGALRARAPSPDSLTTSPSPLSVRERTRHRPARCCLCSPIENKKRRIRRKWTTPPSKRSGPAAWPSSWRAGAGVAGRAAAAAP
jgi:hypothetical protein